MKYRKLTIEAVTAVEDDIDDAEAVGRAYLEVLLLLKTMATRAFLGNGTGERVIGVDFPVVSYTSVSEEVEWPPPGQRKLVTAPTYADFTAWLGLQPDSDPGHWRYIRNSTQVAGLPYGSELHVVGGYPHGLEFTGLKENGVTVIMEAG
jgi:hypothetical protein